MSNVIDNLKSKITTPAAMIARLQFKIEVAQSNLTDLLRQHGALALEAEQTGDSSKVEKHQAQIVAARSLIAQLQAAHSEALAKEQKTVADKRAAEHAALIKQAKKHLAERDEAASGLVEAITLAAERYDAMTVAGEAALATGLMTDRLTDNLSDEDQLYRLFLMECFRIGLPGSCAPDAGFEHQPEKLTPMLDRLKENSAAIIAVLSEVK